MIENMLKFEFKVQNFDRFDFVNFPPV